VNSRPLCLVVHDAVAADAPPDAQDTLVQAQAIGGALARLGWRAETLALDLDLGRAAEALQRRAPDLVFNLVEAPGGKGRLIGLGPDLFEALDVPYTGASAAALAATSNKPAAKARLAKAGLPTPPMFRTDSASDRRWIVKSAWEHASLGLDGASVVAAGRVPAAIAERQSRFGGEWFAEAFIEGREFSVALLGPADAPTLLPPAEIRFDAWPAGRPRIVGYAAKWHEDSAEYRGTTRSFAPARDPELAARLHDLALACWDLFGLSGHARVDFRMDAADRLWILEVNANPCLAPDAGFAAAAAEAGIGFDAVIARILDAARPAARRAAVATST
jgi:D-alanine-D-alanine ligase